MGDKGETRPRESGRTMQHRSHVGRQWETVGGTMGDNGRHARCKKRTHHPTQAHISRETMGDNEKQDFGKVDHPTQAHVGRQWETIGDNGRQWETRGDNRRQG